MDDSVRSNCDEISFQSAPGKGPEYCDERVCLSVFLHVCLSEAQIQTLPKARLGCSSGGVLIRYVLPVFWMTLCFLLMDPMTARRYGSSLAAMCVRLNTPDACYCCSLSRGRRTLRLDE